MSMLQLNELNELSIFTNDNQDDMNADMNTDTDIIYEQEQDQDQDQEEEQDQEEKTVLALPVVYEILDYVHPDLKSIVHREGNTLFENEDNRLPISLIMSSNLEDYFEPVLLSNRFKERLCDECARRGELNSLKWARSKGCPWTKPTTELENIRKVLSISGYSNEIISCIHTSFGRDMGLSSLMTTQRGAIYLAAQAGHLHIIQWARENGCEWDEDTCKGAVKAGHWDVAKWCMENGCACSEALRRKIQKETK